jgi:hypothetical protein
MMLAPFLAEKVGGSVRNFDAGPSRHEKTPQ